MFSPRLAVEGEITTKTLSCKPFIELHAWCKHVHTSRSIFHSSSLTLGAGGHPTACSGKRTPIHHAQGHNILAL